MPDPHVTAAILAGGRASRLGGVDKGLLGVGRRRVIDRQLEALRDVVGRVLIVTNDASAYRGLRADLVPDRAPGLGPLGGLDTALAAAATDRIIVLACDMPFITTAFLQFLAEQGRTCDAAVPRTRDGLQPLCASYSRGCSVPIRRRLDAGEHKVTSFLADVALREIGPDEIAPFDPDGLLFLNLNTPEDYARALAAADRPTD